jgi:hypothetical protein
MESKKIPKKYFIYKKKKIHEAHEADLGYKNTGTTKILVMSLVLKGIEYVM